MSVVGKIDPIDRSFIISICPELTPAERSRILAAEAKAALKDAQGVNEAALGYLPGHETFVDGRRGSSVDTVQPEGVIVYDFDIITDLFAWIETMLEAHSPVRSRRYQKSHVFLADGEVVDPDQQVPDAQEYVFVNTQPYARKIERRLSPQAPEGVYEAVAALAARRFGNVARIRFGFRSALFGEVGTWAATTNLKSHAPSRNRPGAKRRDWLTRQPAIIITR